MVKEHRIVSSKNFIRKKCYNTEMLYNTHSKNSVSSREWHVSDKTFPYLSNKNGEFYFVVQKKILEISLVDYISRFFSFFQISLFFSKRILFKLLRVYIKEDNSLFIQDFISFFFSTSKSVKQTYNIDVIRL